MQSGMDLFYKAFKEKILPLKMLRNIALVAADKTPLLKKQALRYALGLWSAVDTLLIRRIVKLADFDFLATGLFTPFIAVA